MEPVEAKVIRRIPEDRIRLLSNAVTIDPALDLGIEQHAELIISAMGLEIAHKLWEFSKFKRVEFKDRAVYATEIEVIVPLTPDNPWPKKNFEPSSHS